MSKKYDPNYKKGNLFTEEELNPNRPHNYRKTHNGMSPIGNISKTLAEKTPEEKALINKKRQETRRKTLSMKKRAKEILETTINLTDDERGIFLEQLQKDKNISVQDAILYAQVTKAIVDKDTMAAAYIRDTSGQKPKDEVELTHSIDDILKNGGVFELEEDELDEY